MRVAAEQLVAKPDAGQQAGPIDPWSARLPQVVVDGVDGVEGPGRVLEDEPYLPSPQVAKTGGGGADQLLSIEADARPTPGPAAG